MLSLGLGQVDGFSQCAGTVANQALNPTGMSEGDAVGQSFTATCDGTITSIQVTSNANANKLQNVTLRIIVGNPITGTTIQYIEPNITLNGKAVPTLIQPFGGNGSLEIMAGQLYSFTLTQTQGKDLEIFFSDIGTYAGGMAFDGDGQPLQALMQADLIFSIAADVLVPTPVELSAFEVSQSEGGVALQWETQSETNNAGFTVQQSNDAEEWTDLDFVAGAGTTTLPQAYNFLDRAPQSGTSYYRLMQVDFDGAFEYSDTKSISTAHLARVQISPNPVRDEVSVRFPNALPESPIEVEIIDAQGSIVHRASMEPSAAPTISLAHLPAGMYSVRAVGSQPHRFLKL